MKKKLPFGFTKTPIFPILHMELFNKYCTQNLHCSIDDGKCAPSGTNSFINKNGYLLIRNLFNDDKIVDEIPDERGVIKYDDFGNVIQKIIQKNKNFLFKHNDPKYKEINVQVRDIIENILHKKIINNYYINEFYFPGEKIIRGKDKGNYDICAIIQINTNRLCPWELCFETLEKDEILLTLENGSGVAYFGNKIDHWRGKLLSRYNILGKLFNLVFFEKDDTFHHQIKFYYSFSDAK